MQESGLDRATDLRDLAMVDPDAASGKWGVVSVRELCCVELDVVHTLHAVHAAHGMLKALG